VTLELRVLRGARAGQREQFAKALISLGRNPLCDFRFDPQLDLDVSARHAEIEVVNSQYVLRDAQSTNGTFVNGARIPGNWVLHDGDVVTFGAHGPQIVVRLLAPPYSVRRTAEDIPKLTAEAIRGARGSVERAEPPTGRSSHGWPQEPPAGGSTTQRIAIAVREHTKELRRALIGAAALAVAAIGVAYWLGWREREQRDAALTAMNHTNDSLEIARAGTIQSLSQRVAGLDSALANEHAQSDRLRAQLQKAGHGPEGDAIAKQLSASEAKRRSLLDAASSYESIFSKNGSAVTLIAVQWPDGRNFSGTGFCVTAKGVIVTNKHLVTDSLGHTPARIAVIFSDTKAWLEAHVVRSSPDADLSLLQIDRAGPYPWIGAIAKNTSAIPVGAPVVTIGYPLGTETPMEGSGTKITARSSLFTGTLSKHLEEVLQLDAYAGAGSSGSPVFDLDGRVVGVVYGGAREAQGRIVYAVPADKLTPMLAMP
jgi:S1-C subfamily serine protease/pSer/pThr/pTyr-binding forkhead associated (FHA) protein